MSDTKLLSGSRLKGTKVVTPDHKELGEIVDVMIDPVNGNIVYAVLSFGGFLGFGEKYFAMPWAAFYLDTVVEDKVILNVDKEKLKDAPGFDKNDWPSRAQWSFVDDVYRYFGYEAYTQKRLIGKPHPTPSKTPGHSAGLGNSGEAATFGEAGIGNSAIKNSGIK